jgi:hypothetical protein
MLRLLKRLMATRISSVDYVQRNGIGSALVASIIDVSFDIGSELLG